MASILGIRTNYKYALQNLGGTLEEVNGVPPSPTDDVRDKSIAEAINWYSRRVPRVAVSLLNAIADGFYQLPNDWQFWSRMISVEFPINQNPTSYIPLKYVNFQQRETLSYFMITPNPSGQFRIAYTTVHGGGPDNVASIVSDHEAIIGRYAAAVSALDFAARYAGSVQNNLDAVQYRTKEQEWRSVAEALIEQADKELRQHEFSQSYATDNEARYLKGWR